MIKKLILLILAASIALCPGCGIQAMSSGVARGVIVIDPGHGGQDGGAVSVTGLRESDINLQISKRLEYMLAFLGAAPVMTREDDVHLGGENFKKAADIKQRLTIAQDAGCNILVSIHQNFFTDSRYGGAQVFYGQGEGSEALAELIQQNLRLTLDVDNDRKIKNGAEAAYLLKNAKCTAVLVECGFLSNYEDDALLQTDEHQKKIAASIATTLMKYQEGLG